MVIALRGPSARRHMGAEPEESPRHIAWRHPMHMTVALIAFVRERQRGGDLEGGLTAIQALRNETHDSYRPGGRDTPLTCTWWYLSAKVLFADSLQARLRNRARDWKSSVPFRESRRRALNGP